MTATSFRFLITEASGYRWVCTCSGWNTQVEALAATRRAEHGATVVPLHGISGYFGQFPEAWLNR